MVKRRALRVAAFPAAVLLASCGFERSRDENASAQQSPVIGGNVAADPEQSTIIDIERKLPNTTASYDEGSGTLLTEEWVLTAAHVLDFDVPPSSHVLRHGGNNPPPPLVSPHYGARIVKHPHPNIDAALIQVTNPFPLTAYPNGYTRNPSVQALTGPQVVQAQNMICYGYGRGTDNGSLGTLRWAVFTPDLEVLPNNTVDVDHYRLLPNPANGGTPLQTLYKGDSGGPCFLYTTQHPSLPPVAGVINSIAPALPDGGPPPSTDVQYAYVVAPSAIDKWVSMILPSFYSENGDVNLDNRLDAVAISAHDGFIWLSILFGQDKASDAILVSYPVAVPPPIDPKLLRGAAAVGDFDGDGDGDLFAVMQGSGATGIFDGPFVYLNGPLNLTAIQSAPADISKLLASASTAFTSASLASSDGTTLPVYKEFRVKKLNNDQYDDLEAITQSGEVDLYYGSQSGLKPGVLVSGWPTSDGKDGRFLSHTGPGLITVVYESTETAVYPYNPSEPLKIEVFDGDVGGMSDNAIPGIAPDDGKTKVACYTVESCDNLNQCTVIAVKDDLSFPDNAWGELHSVQVPNAYYYKVRVTLGSCDSSNCSPRCDATGKPPANASNLANNVFKIRANAMVGADATDWAFMAMDAYTPNVPVASLLAPVPDTTFDGSFSLPLYLWEAPDDVVFTNCDADLTTDGQVDLFDATKVPGVAVGANDQIRFSVLWFNPGGCQGAGCYETQLPSSQQQQISAGALLSETSWDKKNLWTWYLDPSGNEECETFGPVSALNKSGFWTWVWDGVYPVNNVKIEPLKSSTQIASLQMPYSFLADRKKLGLPSPSTAKPIDWWRTSPAKVVSALPITLGPKVTISDPALVSLLLAQQGFSALPINGSTQAWKNALDHGKVTICHKASSELTPMTIASSAVASHLSHGDDISIPHAMEDMVAQLTVATLNLKATSLVGENFSSAVLYGRSETVGEIVGEAVTLLTGIDGMCSLTPSQVDRINWLTRRLKTINAGAVSYRRANQFQQLSIPKNLQRLRVMPKIVVPQQTETPPNWPHVGL